MISTKLGRKLSLSTPFHQIGKVSEVKHEDYLDVNDGVKFCPVFCCEIVNAVVCLFFFSSHSVLDSQFFCRLIS